MKSTNNPKKNLYIFGAVAVIILAIILVLIVRVSGTSYDENNSDTVQNDIDTYSENELQERLGNPDSQKSKNQQEAQDQPETQNQAVSSNSKPSGQKNSASDKQKAGQEDSGNDSSPGINSNDSKRDQSVQEAEVDETNENNEQQDQSEPASSSTNNSNQGTSARIVLPKSDEEQQVIDGITSAFTGKLGKSEQEISVVVDFEEGGYAKGVYGFETEAGGGLFLAQGSGADWNILWYGQGSEFCANISEYDIPAEMRLECE